MKNYCDGQTMSLQSTCSRVLNFVVLYSAFPKWHEKFKKSGLLLQPLVCQFIYVVNISYPSSVSSNLFYPFPILRLSVQIYCVHFLPFVCQFKSVLSFSCPWLGSDQICSSLLKTPGLSVKSVLSVSQSLGLSVQIFSSLCQHRVW